MMMIENDIDDGGDDDEDGAGDGDDTDVDDVAAAPPDHFSGNTWLQPFSSEDMLAVVVSNEVHVI